MEYIETKYFTGAVEALVDKQEELKREISLAKWREEDLKKKVAELEAQNEKLKTRVMEFEDMMEDKK